MKNARFWALMALVIAAGLLSGCLNMEGKEYRFTVKSDGSGEGAITFINIVSQDDEERDVSFKDFGELVTDYIDGTKWEDEHSGFQVTGKRLFEKDGQLWGEMTFTFASLDSAGFLRFTGCDCAPILYHLGQLDESYHSSNGQTLGKEENPSFISWLAGTKEFTFRTTVLSDMENTRSLLPHYKTWKETQK